MKVVIDIDENCFNSVRYYDGDIMNEWSDHIGCAIFNGIPLEKVFEGIKSEIIDLYTDRPKGYNHYQRTEFASKVLDIIDKHISGKE